MSHQFITAVKPLENYILQVEFISGSMVLLDMSPHLKRLRFQTLQEESVWRSAVTNGMFVRFGDVELSHNEILDMLEQPRTENEKQRSVKTR